jgi:hypothetical protein
MTLSNKSWVFAFIILLVIPTTSCKKSGQDTAGLDSARDPASIQRQIERNQVALAPWTVLIYGGVDSSSEPHIMPHLQSLGEMSSNGQRGRSAMNPSIFLNPCCTIIILSQDTWRSNLN